MSRVDFYILSDHDEDRRQVYLCRIADKASRLGHSVWIQTASEDGAAALDARLWTFAPASFVAHERADDGDTIDTSVPVLIAASAPPDATRALLINDADSVPPNAGHFERIAEIVNQADDNRGRGRRHYADYRDQGFDLHHHRVD